MPSQTTHPFLPALSPRQQKLSFCEAAPASLSHWIQSLPKANLGEMSRQIYNALIELNQLVTPADNRFGLLELLRAEVFFICQQLQPELLNQPVVRDKRSQQIDTLCQSLLVQLAAGYKLIVVQQQPSVQRNKQAQSNPLLLGAALQRCCHALRALLLHSSGLHRLPAPGLWLELHQSYQTACKLGAQQMALADPQSTHEKRSIEQTWLCAVLLGCVRTNQLHQTSIAPLLRAFEGFTSHVVLQTGQAAQNSLFIVALGKDEPPRYRTLVESNHDDSLLGLDLASLTRAIKQCLALPEENWPQSVLPLHLPKGLNAALLQHLLRDFSQPAERHPRSPAQGELSLCVGLRAVHYYLAGERAFESWLGQGAQRPAAGLFASVETEQSTNWGSTPANVDNLVTPAGNLDFAGANALRAEPVKVEQIPLHRQKLLNQSLGGYCLSWQNPSAPLQVGEVVGIREANLQDWSIGQLSWVQQDGETVRVGVQQIAGTARPCALQRVGRAGEAPFLPALLLPVSEADTSLRLIAPSLPFAQGDQVRITSEGKESLALLIQRQSGSSNFNQFEYRLAEEEENKAPIEEVQSTSGRETNFDALWNTL